VTTVTSFRTIRAWDGSQYRAFEELCYQLRDSTPPSAELVKTGNPDAGLEWYVRHRNATEWGWQAKYTFGIDDLLRQMERSLKTVVKKRPKCRRLTFCIPFDLPDNPGEGEHKSAREKFDDRKTSWRKRIPGADRVSIDLWTAGDLLERLGRPEHRGTLWFFWQKEVFAPAWCRTRLDVTTRASGKRYTPSLNVELPVPFALEGLGRSSQFHERYLRRRGAVIKACRGVTRGRWTGLGVTKEMRSLAHSLHLCESILSVKAEGGRVFERTTMLAAVQSCLKAVWRSYPDVDRSDPKELYERGTSLRHDLSQLGSKLQDLSGFLEGTAAYAAEQGMLLVTGSAGQGKTHLFCDAGQRALDTGRPCVVLLGQHFVGNRVFSDLAEQLGLPPLGASELLGAMRAAGEAAGTPFVLLIDALNDSGEPAAWRHALPALLAEIAQHAPWIVLGVSVRSSYLDLIASDDTTPLPTVEHPGFDGYEYEAAQRYFESFGLEQPRIPLLLPEFTNPLFLRLYCEALASSEVRPPEEGHAHITDVFDRYLAAKNKQISSTLALDPTANIVAAAVGAFADAVATTDQEWMLREDARAVIDKHAPRLHAWPKTLFGQLLAEGVLSVDVAYRRTDADWELVEGVRFTFQRFADYRIAASLFSAVSSRADLEGALEPGQSLRAKVRDARAGLVEALAVLLPERYGVELIDAARWRLRGPVTERWDRATLASIGTRRDDAASKRTAELLRRISTRSHDLFEMATEVLISVAARPAHALNGEFLHSALMRWQMAERDVAWGITTYGWMDQRGPLDRLIRWAAAGPYDQYSDEVLELATIPLVWTLSSPNRTMRDYVTKALCRLLTPKLGIMERLVTRFRGVDDPYVLQRLAVIAHGAILVGGHADPDGATRLARLLVTVVQDPRTSPDVLLRDAARGSMEWCHQAALVNAAEYESAKPPYKSQPPERPRTQRQLEKAYKGYGENVSDPGYGHLFSSIFHLGDFGRYVIESDVCHHFTRFPLDRPVPRYRKPRQRKPDAAKLAEFEAALTDEQVRLLSDDGLEALFESLSTEQKSKLLVAVYPPAPPTRPRGYPTDLAQRWVFERAVSLGWTPERFAWFDSNYRYMARIGRSGHKPERFGKKYQWIALHELLARVADNFHMSQDWSEEIILYQGPWQFLGRDIDPTLPPAHRLLDEDGVEYMAPTYQADSEDSWWVPPGPHYSGNEPQAPPGWATRPDDIPDMELLTRRVNPQDGEWIVVQAYYNWDERLADDQDHQDRVRRDMWSHIYGWIVTRDDAPELFQFLGERSLMNRWMPEGATITDAAYVAEMPWAMAANEYPPKWEPIVPRDGSHLAIDVYPAWEQYYWEGNVWDSSIQDGVTMVVPARELFDAGGLRWIPGSREWRDSGGSLVAQYRESKGDRRSALLIKADWLATLLQTQGWSLVLGRLGEKQLIGGGFGRGQSGGWSEINDIAAFDGETWTFGGPRIDVHPPS